MLSLLRKVRKRFINDGATRNYLLYAIGEFVLIVAGILVALQINNWNNEIQQNKKEIQWLQNLRADLKNDEIFLNEQIEYCKESEDNIRKIILMMDDPTVRMLDTIDFFRQLKRVTMTYFFKPINTTYLEMTGSGDLSTLSRRELMRKVIEYHQSAQLSDELNEVIKEVKWFRYNEILEDVLDPLFMADMTEDIFVQLNQWPQNEIDHSLLSDAVISLDQLRNSHSFRKVLARSLDMTVVQRGDLYRMLQLCQEVSHQFDLELEEIEKG